MATLAVTIPVTNGNAGAILRAISKNIALAAANTPDTLATGASVVLTVDNAPGTGLVCGVQITGGPYQSGSLVV